MERSRYNIAVAGTGYVGLSMAVLLSQHNHVTAVDVEPEMVHLINAKKSPIRYEYIEKYLVEKNLDMVAALDGKVPIVRRILLLFTLQQIMAVQKITLIAARWKRLLNWYTR